MIQKEEVVVSSLDDAREEWMLSMTRKGFVPLHQLGAPPPRPQGRHSQPPPSAVIVWSKGWEYAVWIEAVPACDPELYPHWFLFRKGMNDLGYNLPMWWWQWRPVVA